ncbi:MAG: hypothetical protein KR126chlam4_00770 [Candidatus Anoxychlamydiales bacterium]|nr:hypothetical protein [Candidatus Anoxychlamydiales bacterium]NGX40939.1 hypothetical protein [Candidatus Anoxychlamydiales bacterium]
MRVIRFIVLLLILVGAINWGLWGVFQYDVIQDVFGSDQSTWARIAYTIVGLAGIYGISFLFSKGTCGYGEKHHSEENK